MIYDCEAYFPITGNQYLYGKTFGAEELLRMEDEAGVQAAFTMAQGYDGSNNQTVHEAMLKHPRIIGCCLGEPAKGKAAVEEFRMTVKEWGFRGLKLPLANSDTVNELAKAADEMGVAVTIHTNGNAATYSRISEIAKKFPRLPIIMEHMGYRYHVDLAVEITRKHSNLHMGTTVVAAAEPFAVKRAIQEAGAEKVLFGSNAPWALPRIGVEGIKRLKLGKEDEELVFAENFKRIFRIG
ncbi:MAG: amidohydrolase family protein [Candidatus Latescibacterota bacterium]